MAPTFANVFANDSHLRDKILFLDPGATLTTPYTITIFPHTLAEATPRDNARITIIATSNSLVTIDIVADGTTRILDPTTFTPVVTLTAFLAGEAIELIYSGPRDQWLVKQRVEVEYIEEWAGTPIVDINAKTINWTFTDIGLGASSILFSHSAGVLTYLPSLTKLLNVSFEEISLANFAANNSEVDWEFNGLFVGAGSARVPKLLDFAAHPRTNNLFRSGDVSGRLLMTANDTIQMNCVANGTNASTVDLDSATLTFTVTL